jgi:hypothetical protein
MYFAREFYNNFELTVSFNFELQLLIGNLELCGKIFGLGKIWKKVKGKLWEFSLIENIK